ncbi:MAG: hypothetical protein M0P01_03670 [Treponema sp.]|nr:hypothetical protein [Treponema sp.]
MKERIRKIILDQGADICGIANVSGFSDIDKEYRPDTIWNSCKSVIVFGIALPKSFYDIQSRLIYAHFITIAKQNVDEISFKAAVEIERSERIKALPLPCDDPYEYWQAEKMEGHGLLSMKHAAVLAGIGSIGKNTLLINKKFGNRLTLGALLVDSPLDSDELIGELCIPGCRLCIDSCPSGAISNKTVNQKKCRLTTYKTTERGFDTIECYKCRSVCPLRYGNE